MTMIYEEMTALITGASGGLGEAFARQLAELGASLILVARSEDRLKQLAEMLRTQHKVQVTAIAADLSSAEAIERLTTEIRLRGLKVDILVNSAGLGVFENFLDTSLTKQMRQLDVNVLALVSLTHSFAPSMVAAHRGGIINLASTAGFQPLAGATVYAASKSFVLLFSEG